MRRTVRLRFAAAALLISAYFFLLVRPSLGAFFTRDDLMNLYRSWSFPAALLLRANVLFFWASPFYRPLPSLWYRVVFQFAGFHALPFHLVYLLGFLLNLLLTYSLVRRLSGSREVASVATLLGSYHHSMAALYFDTAYIYDALCYAFFFSTILLYVRVRQQDRALRPWELTACCVLYICALNSKEMALTLPLILLLYELLYHPVRSWTLRQGRGVLLIGAITLIFVAGRATGAASLLALPSYRPVLTWTRFMETSRHYLGELFSQGRDWPAWAVLALWAAMFLIAWAARSKPLQFAWLLLILGAIPIAFVDPRGSAQYYIPWFGWLMYGSTALVKSIELLTPRLPPEKIWIRGGAILVGLSAMLFPYYHRQGWSSITSVAAQAPIDRAVTEQLRSLEPQLRPGSRLFFYGEALPMPWVDLFFLTRLNYQDNSLDIERVKDLNHEPDEKELADYDHVFDYQAGHFLELTRPWRRASRPWPAPMLLLNPNGAEVYHLGWTPVTAEAPAGPGELLIAKAIDLGPTDPPVAKGAPFPSIPLAHVAAKLAIRVDGLPADPVNQIGWPEAVNTYRLDFRVPKGTHSGMAEVEVTADGVTGQPVALPIR